MTFTDTTVRIGVVHNAKEAAQQFADNLKAMAASTQQLIDQSLTQQWKKSGAAVEDASAKTKRSMADMASSIGVVNVASQALLGTLGGIAGAVGIDAVIKGLEKSFTTFATGARQMDVLRASTRYHKEELEDLKKRMPEIATALGLAPQEATKKFDAFYSSVKLSYNEAINVFRETSIWATVTGNDIDKASVAAANALNHLKVPVNDMPKVFAAWRELIPPAMIGPFAQGAEEITRTWEALGMKGTEHAIALAAIYSNPKLNAQEFHKILGQIESRSTDLGNSMALMLQKIQREGGGPLEVINGLYHAIEEMGGFGPNYVDVAKTIGVSTDSLRWLKETHEGLGTIAENIDKAKRAASNTEVYAQFNKALESLNKLATSTLKVFEEFGGVLNAIKVPEAFIKIAEELGKMADFINTMTTKGLGAAMQKMVVPGGALDEALKGNYGRAVGALARDAASAGPGRSAALATFGMGGNPASSEFTEGQIPGSRLRFNRPGSSRLPPGAIDVNAFSLPGYARGTTFVPEDMIAQLHKGEQIIPDGSEEGIERGDDGGEVNRQRVSSDFDMQRIARATDNNTYATINNTYALENLTDVIKPSGGGGGTSRGGGASGGWGSDSSLASDAVGGQIPGSGGLSFTPPGGGRGGGERTVGGQRGVGSGQEVITTQSGAKFTVSKEHAANFRGFLKDYEDAGGYIDPKTAGGYANRNIAGTNKPSLHGLDGGRAIDINIVGRGIFGRGLSGLPGGVEQEEALARKWGLRPGSSFSNPDRGHYEVNDPAKARAALAAQGGDTQTASGDSGGGGDLDRLQKAIQTQEGYFPGTRAWRNRNPGNIKALGTVGKALAAKYGATGVDEQGHIIFPSREAGLAAHRDFLQGKYHGKSLNQIAASGYAEDPNWGRGVARAGGINPNQPLNLRQSKTPAAAGGEGNYEGMATWSDIGRGTMEPDTWSDIGKGATERGFEPTDAESQAIHSGITYPSEGGDMTRNVPLPRSRPMPMPRPKPQQSASRDGHGGTRTRTRRGLDPRDQYGAYNIGPLPDVEQRVKIRYDMPASQDSAIRDTMRRRANRDYRENRNMLNERETQYAHADIGSRVV